MEAATLFPEVKTLNQAKDKRASRRGQITKAKTRLDEFLAMRMDELSLLTCQPVYTKLKKDVQIHEDIQLRYVQLMTEGGATAAAIQKEEEEAVDTFEEYQALIGRYEELKECITAHQNLRKTARKFTLFRDSSSVTAPDYEKEIAQFRSSFDDIMDRLQDLTLPASEGVQDQVIKYQTEVLTCLNDCREKRAGDHHSIEPSSSATPTTFTSAAPKIKLELPEFNGRPTEWKRFHGPFTHAMDSRGSTFTEQEKLGVLLKSMKDEDARRIVEAYSNSSDCYREAMEALEEKFGSPIRIFPMLVRKMVESRPMDYSEEGLALFRTQYLNTFKDIQELGCDSLSQFAAALACDNFSPRLLEEWTKHTAMFEKVPDLEDMRAYTRPLEHRLSCMKKPTTSTMTTPKHSSHSGHRNSASSNAQPNSKQTCPACSEPHKLSRCSVFSGYDAARKKKLLKSKKGCLNCLSMGHLTHACTSAFNCKKCNARHHTSLHIDETPREDSSSEQPALIASQKTEKKTSTTGPRPTVAFLHTAIVTAVNGDRNCTARAALDTGAASSLISESLASQLKLKRHSQRLTLSGAYGEGVSKHWVQLSLRSRHDPALSVDLILSVIPKLPNAYPPNRKEEIAATPHLKDLQLADPDFGGALDLLIGSLDYGRCVKGSLEYNLAFNIAALPTIFGWTVTGPLDYQPPKTNTLKIGSPNDQLSQDLSLLWELEKTPAITDLTSSTDPCVQHFQDTRVINEDGRYAVQLPRIPNPPTLGASRNLAVQRFLSNEKSLQKKNKLGGFREALQEYMTLEHAERVPEDQLPDKHYYLPVHGVFKESSTTTKVRPVFDGSARTSSGASLNDTLETGPNLYPLLTDILLRFRSHNIAFSADISKMFREIELQPQERNLHRFIIRDADDKLIDCRMTRLTFGVRCSPFVATQVIRDLAINHSESHPEASRAILEAFYVDDYLSGAQTVTQATALRCQLCQLLSLARMTLRKWRTNDDAFRDSIPEELIEMEDLHLAPPESSLKALGIHWRVSSDSLHVASPMNIPEKTTKRTIASTMGKVFDVLGLYSPITIMGKLLLRRLWLMKVTWDEELPEEMVDEWRQWTQHLPELTARIVPRRHTPDTSLVSHVSLHGFSDASNNAYGAVVYIRQLRMDGLITTSLVISKARVAPLKGLTTPRAELTGALILARLLVYVGRILEITDLTAWTDSSIVLCWLRKVPSSLNTFVGNRVAAIQDLIPDVPWKHVKSEDNPADILSRGSTFTDLDSSSLWWEGPPWLKLPEEDWPPPLFVPPPALPETKAVTLLAPPSPPDPPFWESFSSFAHLVRIYSWIRRYLSNIRPPVEVKNLSKHLSGKECDETRRLFFKLIQGDHYKDALQAAKRKSSVPKGHPLAGFVLTLTEDGLLLASSRVRDFRLTSSPKSLIPLSLKSSLTRLFITALHVRFQHAGPQTLLSIISDTYYIPALRNFLKGLSRRCSICQRAYSRGTIQQLGLLPASRTTPSPPFLETGLDFAGPFYVRRGHVRKPVLDKAYVCVFVCFSTKAVHLELCSDLSTEEFLACLKRFCGRRGTPHTIRSDNGTNFVGAYNHFKEIRSLLAKSSNSLSHFCGEHSIAWRFSPPATPHMGGLWESTVRMMKTLLHKVLGPHHLQFHEMYTVLTEVEATLNSRPLTPLHATDVDDQLTLTPGHFLIGRPLQAPPSLPPTQDKLSTLKRWRLVERLTQNYWTAWKTLYLQSLQKRHRWHKGTHEFTVGDVVFLLEDSSFGYRRWPLARITKTYPGDDGITRVVDVAVAGKSHRRAAHQLIPLFSEVHPATPDSAPASTPSLPPPVCSGPSSGPEQGRDSRKTHKPCVKELNSM